MSIGNSGATMILGSIADLPVIRDLLTTFSYAPNSMLFIRSTNRPKSIRKLVTKFIQRTLVDRLYRLIPSMDLVLSRLIHGLDQ